MRSIDIFAEAVAAELPIDAVGMWQVVPYSRKRYGSNVELMTQAIRRCLLVMFAKGAKPVVAAQDGKHHWAVKDTHGTTHEKMADAIISEWLVSGAEDPPPYASLWFALPGIYEEEK